jgi:O-antigen ligase
MTDEPSSMKPVDGRWTATAIVAAGVGALAFGHGSFPAFLALAGLAVLGTAYAAYHWPRATLVGVAITTLLDPGVAVRFLPTALANGPIGISEPLLAVTGLVALTRVRRAGFRTAVADPTFALMGLFTGVAVASAVVNRTPPAVASLGIIITIDAMVIFFLWIALEPSPMDNARGIAAVVAAIAVVAVFGIAQVVIAPSLLGFERVASRPEDIGRITSILGNPNLMAPLLGLAIPFPLFAGLRLERRQHRAAALVTCLVLVVALILTASHGTWLAAVIGMAIGTALLDWRALVVAVLVAVVAVALVAWMPKHVGWTGPTAPPSSPVPSAPVPEGREASPPPDPFRGMTSEEVRLYFMRTGIAVVMDHPVLGVGPGRYGGAAATIVESPVYEEYGITLGRLRTVHSFWLHIAGEVGVTGLAIFLTIVVSLFIRLCLAARRANGTNWIVIAGVATVVAIVGTNNATEMFFEGNTPAIIVWLVFAAGAAVAPRDKNPLRPRGTAAQ